MSIVPQAEKLLGNDDFFDVLSINAQKTPEYFENLTIYSNYR